MIGLLEGIVTIHGDIEDGSDDAIIVATECCFNRDFGPWKAGHTCTLMLDTAEGVLSELVDGDSIKDVKVRLEPFKCDCGYVPCEHDRPVP